jgi:hypothetical protein
MTPSMKCLILRKPSRSLFARLYGTGPRSSFAWVSNRSGYRIYRSCYWPLRGNHYIRGRASFIITRCARKWVFLSSDPPFLGEQDCQFRKSSLSSEVRIVSIGPSVPRACLQMGLTTGCSDAAINYITRSRRQGWRGWSLARPGFGINGLRRSPAR